MKRPKVLWSILLPLLLVLWSLPLSAGDHAINATWTGPKNEVLGGDCSKSGALITNPVVYTVQYRKVGDSIWLTGGETSNETLDIGGLEAETDYEVRIGPHYAGGTVLCWTTPSVITTLPDQPPQACTDVVLTPLK